MRGPGCIDNSVQQEQRAAFRVLHRIEDHICAIAIVARPWIGRSNFGRAVKHLCPQCKIEGVQALVVVACSVFRRGHHIDHAIRTASTIDCWCSSYADFTTSTKWIV